MKGMTDPTDLANEHPNKRRKSTAPRQSQYKAEPWQPQGNENSIESLAVTTKDNQNSHRASLVRARLGQLPVASPIQIHADNSLCTYRPARLAE
jgi:hypothetical protein